MPQRPSCSIETLPVGIVANRIQARPALATELPLPADMPKPKYWERRLRFILEAAVIGELDDGGLVNNIPQLETSANASSFADLGKALDELYNPLMNERLSTLQHTADWRPVFERLEIARDNNTAEKQPMDIINVLKNKPSVATRQVEVLFKIIRYNHEVGSARRIVAILNSDGVRVSRRQADRGLDAAESLMTDWLRGDPNRTLKVGKNRLLFAQRLGSCLVGDEGCTVDQKDAESAKNGQGPIGCPALKNSKFIDKLMHRAIADGEIFSLF